MDRPDVTRSSTDWLGRVLAGAALAVSLGVAASPWLGAPHRAPSPAPAPSLPEALPTIVTPPDTDTSERPVPSDPSLEIARRARQSVVRITTFAPPEIGAAAIREGVPTDEVRNSQGSGLVVAADGTVLTCYHVVRNAQRIVVDLADGRQLEAAVVGFDAQHDLALVRIHTDPLVPVAWAEDNWPEAGSHVWAVGFPFGGRQMISRGIASGSPAPDEEIATRSLLQADVAMQPGHSGGGWFNNQGELLGVATSIGGKTFQGLSFAIPAATAKRSIESLLGTATRPATASPR